MLTKIKDIAIIIVSLVCIIGGGCFIYNLHPKIQIKEVSKECPPGNNSFTDSVYFVGSNIKESLPFCALNYNRNTGKPYNEYYCYDDAFWNDGGNNYQGISIIKLK